MESRSERPGLRYELKLVADEAFGPELCMLLRLDRAGIRTPYPPRVVQSVYLDTPFQKTLQENLAGLSRREKVRLRWYGATASGVRATLERKCRENSMGWKESTSIVGALDVAGVERHAFMDGLARRCDARWRALLAGFEPAQWVRYRREYFTSADQRVRLTLDRELTFADQRRLMRLGPRERTPSARVLVLELKCAPDDLERARDILGRLPIPLGRCSKFVLAAEPSSGPLPSELEV
ncbi:MAG: VTC domain-containing protein [Planctomycetes bacterium]|nr:VTC domain-containing protein [Planctomycetota bacterium]